jgi:hypothetical protein
MSIDKGTIRFAKVLVDSNGRNHCGITSDVYHNELEKLARANKRETESVQQAYCRLAETSETGALLFKAALWAPKPETAPQDFVRPTPPPRGPNAALLNRIVDDFVSRYNRSNEKKLSRAQGFDRVYNDPANRDLREKVKAEELTASRAVRDQRDPIWSAQSELETDFRLGRSPGSARL